MSLMKLFTGLVAAGALCIMLAPKGQADEWNKKTNVNFSSAVEIPGKVVLPAGDYVIKLMDSQSNRHIVQIWNKDENKLLATVLAFSAQRLEPTSKSVFTFYETRNDSPPALKDWFYPGNTIGNEFAYPKPRASEIAQQTGLKVPIQPEDNSTNEEYAAPSTTTTAANNNTSSTRSTTVIAQTTPPPAPVATTPAPDTTVAAPQAMTPPAASTQPVETASNTTPTTPAQLPRTGSDDPMLLALGVGALTAGLFGRYAMRRATNH